MRQHKHRNTYRICFFYGSSKCANTKIKTHTGHVFLDGSSKCANTNIETHTGHVFLDGSSKCGNINIETHTGHVFLMELLNTPTLT